jgi:hypothetical protein
MPFLQNLSFTRVSGNAISDLLGSSDMGLDLSALLGKAVLYAILAIVIIFALYIYLSLAYSKIGSKTKLNSPGIAWAPMGSLAVIFESSKLHWWPFLMLTIGYILGYIIIVFYLVISSSTIIYYLGIGILIATTLIFAIMSIIWHWKTYEAIEKPGWWILVPVISGIVGFVATYIGTKEIGSSIISTIGLIMIILGGIAHLIFIGIAAWSESEHNSPISQYPPSPPVSQYSYSQ